MYIEAVRSTSYNLFSSEGCTHQLIATARYSPKHDLENLSAYYLCIVKIFAINGVFNNDLFNAINTIYYTIILNLVYTSR